MRHRSMLLVGARVTAAIVAACIPARVVASGVPFGYVRAPSTYGSHQAFLTSTTHFGNIGGVAGADGICAARATAAGFAGTWRAIISVAGNNASTRLTIVGPVYNVRPGGSGGPQLVANDAADLWDGTIANPISWTETGSEISFNMVMTGMQANGSVDGTNTCTDYTLATGNGRYGLSNGTTDWNYYTVVTCASGARLYCISQ